MSAAPEKAPRGRWLIWAVVLVVLAAGAYFAWRWFATPTPPDMTAVLAANTRGVGLMDQYRYEEAVKAFEEVVKSAPDWVPGRINLGIALMNAGQEQKQGAPEQAPQGRKHPNLKRATDLFREILKQEPQNPHAHYCLGIILQYQETGESLSHFEAVTRIDPRDAAAWFKLALLQEDQERRFEYCSKALELDPYLTGALNELQLQLRRRGEDKKADEFLDRFKALTDTKTWFSRIDIKYNDMGRYARVIGGPEIARAPGVGPVPPFRLHDKLKLKLAPGARWATAADLDELRRGVRTRFGATLVVLDYDRDGKPDLFLLGAVAEKGQVRDLLLLNEGGGSFTDVTHEAGLGGARASLGCAVADFDNNGSPDLLITGAGRVWLFRNRGKSGKEAARFEDVSAEAGLDKPNTVCLGATFLDLDQDGDLDLLVAQYGATTGEALALLKGKGTSGPGLAVYLNVGEVPAANPSQDPPPLKPRFRAESKDRKGFPPLLGGSVPAVALAASDLEQDGDLDLVALADRTAPELVLNDRLLT
ncbi:MAG: FG-GAP-like repeat-containing protein, partial [Gemmataceae bacterium]|nr:FG-GAP-like repeat-containing protein [Gemmataceae bacterium]